VPSQGPFFVDKSAIPPLQLHNHVARTNVVERADIRMIERRDRPGFALKAGARIFPRSDVFRQHLDSNRPIQPGIAGLVDFAHSTCSDGGKNFVRTEFVAGGKGHIEDRIQSNQSTGRIGTEFGNCHPQYQALGILARPSKLGSRRLGRFRSLSRDSP
jgi:hypothetical protein